VPIAEAMQPVATAAPPNAPAQPWRRRLARSLLYGRDIDHAAKARARVGLAIAAFSLVYAVIAGRLVLLAMTSDPHAARRTVPQDRLATARPDIVDRNREILATDIRTPSLFAEPNRIIDIDEAVELLTAVMPDLDSSRLRERLASKRRFVWLRREITAEQERDIFRLGLPGIGFLKENMRVFPSGPLGSPVIGYVDVDNRGRGGIEKWLDDNGLADLHLAGIATDRLQEPVELAVDLRVQQAVRDELVLARERFKARAVGGIVTDVRTGEILALVSIPDYDPANPRETQDKGRVNRLTYGLYEMGSTFKALTLAMALDSGKVTLDSTFDASKPLHVGRFTIHDFHAQNRTLSVPEIFTYSSNIGAARIARSMGVDYHKSFLRKLGQLDRLRTELPESREPMMPKHWGELNTVTIAYGHGLAVSPLQATMAVGALMNGGLLIPPTFLKRSEAQAKAIGTQVIKPSTSVMMRYLMRLNAEKGSAKKADIPGYYVGGKTGTAEKLVDGAYSKTKVFTTFMAVLPSDQPQYLLTIIMDEPQGTPETHGSTTAAWNAGAAAGAIITRIAPMLGLEPRLDLPPSERLILAKETR
jgi:cell division protein FtsI (penicillin-binding protein 3)